MEMTPNPTLQALDADEEMSNAQEVHNQAAPPPNNPPLRTINGAPASYASALKRTAKQAGNETPVRGMSDDEVEQYDHSETEEQEYARSHWLQKSDLRSNQRLQQ